ncbi:Hypothetical protein NTJ_02300 [Nesidiocoris tenuis]|uniref:Uncharacterized protein n=1 Tax=Nesidiocoris tenuis TaxID=355587 RepID=A0ABN7AE16_9HEMI|nr:Hypothetical protein NTJ_02300 [Nesidiocoris tenuis]
MRRVKCRAERGRDKKLIFSARQDSERRGDETAGLKRRAAGYAGDRRKGVPARRPIRARRFRPSSAAPSAPSGRETNEGPVFGNLRQ